MKRILSSLGLFLLVSCNVESLRQSNNEFAVSNLSNKQTLLANKWRDLEMEENQCLSDDCVKYLFYISFTENKLIISGVDKTTNKILKQTVTSIEQLDDSSFQYKLDGTFATYEIYRNNLRICSDWCRDLTLYKD